MSDERRPAGAAVNGDAGLRAAAERVSRMARVIGHGSLVRWVVTDADFSALRAALATSPAPAGLDGDAGLRAAAERYAAWEPNEFYQDWPADMKQDRNALRAALASSPASAGLDVERLAQALLTAVPGYHRWLSPPMTTGHEAAGRIDAMESEARTHARWIAEHYGRAATRPAEEASHE